MNLKFTIPNIKDYKYLLSDCRSFAVTKLDYENLKFLPLTPPSSGSIKSFLNILIMVTSYFLFPKRYSGETFC
jgi:hypothetical protein